MTKQISLEESFQSTRGGGREGGGGGSSDIKPMTASRQLVTERTEEEVEEGWTAEDRPLVDSCVQLVKVGDEQRKQSCLHLMLYTHTQSAAAITDGVCRAVVSHGTSTTAEQVGELDETTHIIQQLSPL